MKKRGKKVKVIDYEALERVRAYTMKQIVKFLNDDSCNLSSCEIRKHLLDAIE
jgi:hypothetical protein